MNKPIGLIFTLLLLSACSPKYVIEAEYPKALVPPIPIKMNLVTDEEFNNYVYSEVNPGTSSIEIRLGQAQVDLFENIASELFTGDDDGASLTMVPEVKRFQYAFPRESRSQVYEVWIRYNISIQESDGTEVANWLLTGYGKTPTALLKTRTEAVNAATNVALRDIGAQLSIGFKRQPDIALWLASNVESKKL